MDKVDIHEESCLLKQVYHILRQAVIVGKLQPGEKLVERSLAKQLGVSRTPIRESIRKLELEGLVKHIPNRGVFVTRISSKDVWDIYNIRSVLEGLVARMATKNAKTDELKNIERIVKSMESAVPKRNMDILSKLHIKYNKSLYSMANNPRLYHMCCNLMDYVVGFTRIGYAVPGRIYEATKEHRLLFETIKQCDSHKAEEIARKHVENSCNAYFIQLALLEDSNKKDC